MSKFLKFAFLAVIFLNVTVDISHKILLQNIAFKVFDGSEQALWISIINGLIIIPFLLLFTLSGFLSDKYPKNKILFYGAISSLVLAVSLYFSYSIGNFYLSMGLLFLLAIQSAIYSPAKFGLIRDLYHKDNLAAGNAHVQATSMISILFTMGAFSFFFEKIYQKIVLLETASTDLITSQIMEAMIPLTGYIIIIAAIELILAYAFSSSIFLMGDDPDKKLDKKDYFTGKLLINNISHIKTSEVIFLSVIGLSVFWGISQGMMAVFPAFAKENLGITDVFSINAILAASGIGVGLGSYLYSKMSKNYIETSVIPISAIGISLMIYFSTIVTTESYLYAIFFMFGLFGGLFIVPLNSLIQFNANKDELGTILAGSNWFQSVFMFSVLVLTSVVSFYDLNAKNTIYILMSISIAGAVYTIVKYPESLLKFFVGTIVGFKYKLEVFGLKHIPSEGGVLLLGNHVSWLDWAIVQMSMPRRVTFVMDKGIYNKWFLNWFLRHLSIIPISGSSKDSMKRIATKLDEGELVVLFPEGAITRTGHLGEFKKGFEKILSMTEKEIPVVPFYIRGLWESMFSRANNKYKKSSKTKIVSVSYAHTIDKESATANRIKSIVMDLATDSWKDHVEELESIPHEIFNSLKTVKNNLIVADSTGVELSGHKFLVSSIIFKNLLKKKVQGQNIGLLVPSTSVGSIVNTSILMMGKTAVNINYTSDLDALIKSIEVAEIKSIVTSKKFISKLEKKGISINLLLEKVDVVYLEDFKENVSLFKKVSMLLLVKLLPTSLLKRIYVNKRAKEKDAFIIFSSGSEGTPKGIRLSHNNILANTQQTASILNVNDRDVIVGSLPLFHSFGICVTTCLPLIEGIQMVAHPDPTDGLGLGKLVHKYQATIMCGTSTFFRLYTVNRKVHPLMFSSLRYIVAGAEKLNQKVKDDFKAKFGKDILEGYGATETAPVACCNIPDVLTPEFTIQKSSMAGSVGMPIPGTSIKIMDPEKLSAYKDAYSKKYEELLEDMYLYSDEALTELMKDLSYDLCDVNEAGMILISGPQIMEGYLNNSEKTKESLVMIDGKTYYITGDKGKLDEDGFLYILDRYSRFAKLGGEMISLGAVEVKLAEVTKSPFPDLDAMCVALKDDKKGEKLVLLVSGIEEQDIASLKDLINQGFENKLMIPSVIKVVPEIPKLGTGKKDFNGGKKLAEVL